MFCFAVRAKNSDDDSTIKVAAGLLEGAKGARAEEWVDWRLGIRAGRVDHIGEALDGEFVKRLEGGFERWRDGGYEGGGEEEG